MAHLKSSYTDLVEFDDDLMMDTYGYPPVMTNIASEHGHRNSEFVY